MRSHRASAGDLAPSMLAAEELTLTGAEAESPAPAAAAPEDLAPAEAEDPTRAAAEWA